MTMRFERTKLAVSASWVAAVAAVSLASGIAGTVPVLWASAVALIPAAAGFMLWQEPPRTVSQIIRDANIARRGARPAR